MKRLGQFAFAFLLIPVGAFSCPANPLVNSGFEDLDENGTLRGWTVLTGLDDARYGQPEFVEGFDDVRPVRGEPGQGGSRYCLAFPARGTWYCRVFTHSRGNGEPERDGRERGKAVAYQTVEVEPGTYRFGAWLRTADGDQWSAGFRLGWSTREPPRYAHDASTGIRWSENALADETRRLGRPRDRGDWAWYETEPFQVKSGEDPTVWIRFDYVNENQFRARWQADDAALVPLNTDASDRNGTIYGIVVDQEDRPVPGALGTLVYSGEETHTDGAGTFTFRDVAAGTHELEIRKGKMRMVAMEPDPVTVPAGGTTTVEVALRAPSARTSWRDVTDGLVKNSGLDVSPDDPDSEVASGWAEQQPGGGSSIDHTEGRHGPSLRVEGNMYPAVVWQDLAAQLDVRSGPYRALAWVRTSADFKPGGAYVRLLAIDERGAALASAEARVPAAGDWKLIHTGALTVAETDAARLVIELSGGSSGTVWFDEIRIETAGEN